MNFELLQSAAKEAAANLSDGGFLENGEVFVGMET